MGEKASRRATMPNKIRISDTTSFHRRQLTCPHWISSFISWIQTLIWQRWSWRWTLVKALRNRRIVVQMALLLLNHSCFIIHLRHHKLCLLVIGLCCHFVMWCSFFCSSSSPTTFTSQKPGENSFSFRARRPIEQWFTKIWVQNICEIWARSWSVPHQARVHMLLGFMMMLLKIWFHCFPILQFSSKDWNFEESNKETSFLFTFWVLLFTLLWPDQIKTSTKGGLEQKLETLSFPLPEFPEQKRTQL